MTPEEELDGMYWPITQDTWNRAQFYDCKQCRAVTLDREAHANWHMFLDVQISGPF